MREQTDLGRAGARLAALALVAGMLSGCATTRMAIRNGELATKTEMSQSVFLELRGSPPPTVYVSESSSLGEDIAVRERLEVDLQARGYTLVDEPDYATYILQLNHLSMVESELDDGETLNDAIQQAWIAGAGAGVAAIILGQEGAADEIGLVVGVLAFLLDSHSKNVAHTLTTDVLVTEVAPFGEGGGEPRRHETRIVSAASKMNLGREDAVPAVAGELSRALAGLLPSRVR